MILLDTNVISEPLRSAPNPRVTAWLDTQALETLYLSTMTVAELRAGVALMPKGRKRDKLHDAIEQKVLPSFAGRVLPFDATCTQAYAETLATVRKAGRGIGTADAIIAAIARAHGLIVATRDANPFAAAGLKVINPWEEEEVS